jgi:hypothetical protein
MKNIFQSRTPTEAALVRNMLVENGIDASVVEQTPSFTGLVCSEVWISREEDGDLAIRLVRELYAGREEDTSWNCVECRESVPAQFESCWHCGADAPRAV